jgi:hypothetical protein
MIIQIYFMYVHPVSLNYITHYCIRNDKIFLIHVAIKFYKTIASIHLVFQFSNYNFEIDVIKLNEKTLHLIRCNFSDVIIQCELLKI